MKNYLFVCRAGITRSPAAASAAEELAEKKKKKILTEHVGLYSGAKISAEKISTFDKIFVMEKGMEKILRQEYHYKKPIISLDIKDKDKYKSNDPELYKTIMSKLRRHI